MSHYDDCYAQERREQDLKEKERTEKFLKALQTFRSESYRTSAAPPGYLDDDFRNMTRKLQSRLYELRNLEG